MINLNNFIFWNNFNILFFRNVIRQCLKVQLNETETFAKLGVFDSQSMQEKDKGSWDVENIEMGLWDGEGVGTDYYDYYFGDLSMVKMLECMELTEK